MFLLVTVFDLCLIRAIVILIIIIIIMYLVEMKQTGHKFFHGSEHGITHYMGNGPSNMLTLAEMFVAHSR